MPLSMRLLAAMACLGLASSTLLAQRPELTQQQSPPKPAPQWLKIIDQGRHDPRLKGYFTPEGLKVEIVADYPVVRNPVGMTFADDGTLYVLEWRPDLPGSSGWPEFAEMIHYKDGTARQVATMKKQVLDLVKVLHDTKGKGTYDQAKIILEDRLPSSILLHDGWLYLTGRGTVRRFKQSKPGGPYDIRQVIARGFCGFHHHQVSGMTIGNDGWLYLTAGDDDNYVEGSDGSRVTVLRTGAIFRCRPDGSQMHFYSMGYRNPYRDVSFDTKFNMFHADNDNEDGSKFTGCRLMHVAEGSDFGWRLRLGARCCSPDHLRGAVFGELPGKMPALLKTGRGSPAGLLIYNDTRFPERFRGLLLYPDVFRKLIRAYKVEPRGATFAVTEEFEFMKSDDPLFRPCQMVLGPDGAMYVCDWRTDSGGAGRLSGDWQHGRIYRVSWGGTKTEPALPLRSMDSWARIVKMSDEELLQTLASPEFSFRQRAQRELVHRGAKNRPALLKLVLDNDEAVEARIAALGALESFWNAEVQAAFIHLLRDADQDVRRLAADGLALNSKPHDEDVHNALLECLGDPQPAVRRAVALAIGTVAAPGAADCLVNAYQFDDGRDLYLGDGILRAIERVGKPGIDQLLTLAESGVDKDRNKVVQAWLTLRTRPAAEAIPRLLENPHLSTDQRARLLRSYRNYLLDPPLSLDPVLTYLTRHRDLPVPVKLAGLSAVSALAEALRANKPVFTRDKASSSCRSSPPWVISDQEQGRLIKLLDETDSSVRLVVMRAVAATHAVKAAPRLGQWLADDQRPLAELAAVVKVLRTLNDRAAVAILKRILAKDHATTGEALTLRMTAFRTLAFLDVAAAQDTARAFLDQNDVLLQREAVQVLGTQAAGAKLVGERYLAKKLPRQLLQPVTDALQKHAGSSPELARMLSEVMKSGLLLSLDKAQVERVRQLVSTQGNAERGKAVFLNTKLVACITCHRLEGVGGNVGPDLTRIWDTQSVDKIMESIIEPSKEIKEGYQTFVATTTRGQVFMGLKVVQTRDEVILRDANARDIHIPTRNLEDLVISKQSLMPANVVSQLTFTQFIDLVAFLKDRKAQESLRGIVPAFWVVGPFGGDLKTAYAPESKPETSASYEPRKGEKVSWQPVLAEPDGYLNLRPIFNRDHISAYALTFVYSPRPQKVQLLIGSTDMVRVWLNSTLVHEYKVPRSARPDQDRVDVLLKEGWNVVLARVINVGAAHGLYLRFGGGEGLHTALTPEGK